MPPIAGEEIPADADGEDPATIKRMLDHRPFERTVLLIAMREKRPGDRATARCNPVVEDDMAETEQQPVDRYA